MRRVSFPVLILASLCLSQIGYSDVREIMKMQEILPEVEKDTLLVFDIDNTLLEPTGNLGSDQWFYYLYKIYKINGLSDHEIEFKANEVWNKAQWVIRVQSVEKETPALVESQQKKNIKTMALTARTLDIADRTLDQLKSVKISFGSHSITQTEMKISQADLHSTEDALFKEGVLFVGEANDKGKVLAEMLQRLHLSPKKIVYVDDKLKHVKNVEKALARLGIPYVGFRYGALDTKVKHYNELMSEVLDKGAADLFLLGLVSPDMTQRIALVQGR